MENKWTETKIKFALDKIFKEHKRCLSFTELKKEGYTGLLSVVCRKYGGVRRAWINFGYEPVGIPKDNRYYNNIENIKIEINKFIDKYGHFPMARELRDLGQNSLVSAICKIARGFYNLRNKMGYMHPYIYECDDGHFCDSRNEVKVDNWLNKNGIRHKRNCKIGVYSADFGIAEKDKTIIEVLMFDYNENCSSKFGLKYINKYKTKKSYYSSEKYKVYEVFPQFCEDDNMLDEEMFLILNAIKKEIKQNQLELSSSTSTQSKTKPKFYWNVWTNVENCLFDAFVKNGGEPPRLADLPMPLQRGIQKHHGGYRKTLNKFGLQVHVKKKKVKSGYYQNIDNVINDIKPIIQMLGHFPSHKEFYEYKIGFLYAQIKKYHDIEQIAQNMGHIYNSSATKGYWSNKANLIKEMKPIALEIGGIPTVQILRKKGRNDLAHFERYITRKELSMVLNLPLIQMRKPRGYWNDTNNMIKELKIVIDQLGEVPKSLSELKAIGRNDIAHGIIRYYSSLEEILKKIKQN